MSSDLSLDRSQTVLPGAGRSAAKPIAIGVVALIFLAYPLYASKGYFLDLGTLILLNGIFLVGLDLAVGHAGLASVGHGALLGLGAYVTGVLTVQYHWAFWPTIIASMVLCALAGLIIGLVTLRLASHYFVIGSFSLALLMQILVQNLTGLTKGNIGLSPVPRPGSIFGINFEGSANFYWLLLFFAAIVILISWLLLRTNLGMRMQAIRENQRLASSLGVSVYMTRLIALVFSAALVAIAGSFQASYLGFINPQLLDMSVGFQAIMALIIGGQRSYVGAYIGAAIFVLLPQIFQFAANLSLVIFGVALVVIIVLAPDGAWGRLRALGRFGLRWFRVLSNRRIRVDEGN